LREAIGAALGYESRERRNTREPLKGVAKVSTAIELEEQLEWGPQVMLEALVVIKFKAKTCGFAMARDRSKRGMDVVPRKANSTLANRDRQLCMERHAQATSEIGRPAMYAVAIGPRMNELRPRFSMVTRPFLASS
jgi:hypothetical protein